MILQTYTLGRGVYACVASGNMVFLDLHRNKYLCLDEPTSFAVQKMIGSNQTLTDPVTSSSDLAYMDVIAELCKRGVLTRASRNTSDSMMSFLPPNSELSASRSDEFTLLMIDVVNYVLSVAIATALLQFFPIRWICAVASRLGGKASRCMRLVDIEKARRVLSAYSKLKIYSLRRRSCLSESLCLKIFMSRYRLYPSWVFGVRMKPFEAHCWLQDGGLVFNDTVAYVKDFTQIMSS